MKNILQSPETMALMMNITELHIIIEFVDETLTFVSRLKAEHRLLLCRRSRGIPGKMPARQPGA
ncbi:hypothetical protein [Rhodopila sp.]|uniref:hypothetical protein n=1 Tax=Rhodopila sp. TaxID=2480087 RepID=UPI003D0B7DB0